MVAAKLMFAFATLIIAFLVFELGLNVIGAGL